MLEKEEIKQILPGIDNIDDGIKIYRRYYSEATESQLGALAIHIQLLNV
jgi:ASC-1-like (ASCH) protein